MRILFLFNTAFRIVSTAATSPNVAQVIIDVGRQIKPRQISLSFNTGFENPGLNDGSISNVEVWVSRAGTDLGIGGLDLDGDGTMDQDVPNQNQQRSLYLVLIL